MGMPNAENDQNLLERYKSYKNTQRYIAVMVTVILLIQVMEWFAHG